MNRSLPDLLQRLVPAGRGVCILAYHLVGAGSTAPVDVPEADFRRQMEELAGWGRAIPLDEATSLLARGAEPTPPAVVLTFDDAYRNFYTRAWPILRGLGLSATLYVPTAFVDSGGPAPMPVASHLPAMSWDELASVREEGVTLGSHSHLHRDLPSLGMSEMEGELRQARGLLHRNTGSDARHFCYPRALWSRRCEAVVRQVHDTAAVAGGTVNRAGRYHPLRLRRVPVRRDLGPSLSPVLDSAVWLREWLADHYRRAGAALQRLAPRS